MKKKKAAKKKVGKKKVAPKKRPIAKKKVVGKKKKTAKRAARGARRPAKRGGSKVEKPIGAVTHFYTHIKVAIVRFARPVRTGVALRFSGATTNFTERVGSMQYDHKPIMLAPKGKQVGIRVGKRVREGDKVYLAN